jgi:hypothetical protein
VADPVISIACSAPGGPCLYASAAIPRTWTIATFTSTSSGVRRFWICATRARLAFSLLCTLLYCSMTGSSLFHCWSI